MTNISTIYPNTVLETMHGMKKSFFNNAMPKVLPGLVNSLRQSVSFDFGSQRPDNEHMAFGCEMLSRGLFTLPFPFTFFTFKAEASQTGRIVPGATLLSIINGQFMGFAFAPIPEKDDASRFVGAVPTMCTMNAEIKQSHPEANAADILVEVYPLVADDVAAIMWGKDPEKADDLRKNRMGQMILQAIGYTVMLMSNGVDTTLEGALQNAAKRHRYSDSAIHDWRVKPQRQARHAKERVQGAPVSRQLRR
jgi:hypothetical protein